MNNNYLRIVNARENNLKSINVDIPLNRFVVFVGKSGSGKSTLAMDVIYNGYFSRALNYNINIKPCALGQRVAVPNSDKTLFEYMQIKETERDNSKISDYINYFSKNNSANFSSYSLGEIIQLLELDIIDLNKQIKMLSLGQFQRLRLFKLLTSIADEKLIILDEPAIGLTCFEAEKLAHVCNIIVKMGFSLIVIEHSLPIIKNSDYIIEFGPGAGYLGGQIVFNGSIGEFENSESNLAKIIWKKTIKVSSSEMIPSKFLRIQLGNQYKLLGEDISLPIGHFTCIAGKTGTGKTTCLDIIHRLCDKSAGAGERRKGLGEIIGKNHIRRPYIIDQSPIGNNSSSIPATYINIMNTIRDIFFEGQTGMKKLTKSDFSFNADGKCKICNGLGYLKDFINEDVIFTKCNACKGLRYNPDTLKARVKNHSIGEILTKTCDELLEINLDSSIISRKLGFLKTVGLSYLVLGQPSISLSGGETQRIKIAKELSKKLGDRCVYILDTPSRGLHLSNIQAILNVLKLLVEKNNTVIIAENNPYFIMSCDWLVYLDKDDKGNNSMIYQGKPKNAPKTILTELGI